jgi:hypothetical protein
VLESEQHRVSRFEPTGRLAQEYRDLNRPTDVAPDGDGLTAVEAAHTQLSAFGPAGELRWRVPRFQSLDAVLPDPDVGGGLLTASAFEGQKPGVYRYTREGRITRLPVDLAPRVPQEGSRFRMARSAVRDAGHGRVYLRDSTGIAILGADGALLRRVDGFRYRTPRPVRG